MAAPSAGTDRLDFCSPGITQAGAASRSTIHHQAGRDWEWDTLGALPWSSRDRIPAEQDFCTQTGFQREPHPSHGRLSSLDPPPEGLDPNKPHREKPAAGKTPREGNGWEESPAGWAGDTSTFLAALIPRAAPPALLHVSCSYFRDKSSRAQPGLAVTWPQGGFGKAQAQGLGFLLP